MPARAANIFLEKRGWRGTISCERLLARRGDVCHAAVQGFEATPFSGSTRMWWMPNTAVRESRKLSNLR
jgi:hypothetical protein